MKQPMKLTPMEYATVEWHWTAPAGQALDDVLVPSYWQHVTAQLRPGHEVKIVSQDRTWWAHLLVRDVGKQEAMVAVITEASFDAVPVLGGEIEVEVKWHSPATKYAVLRKSDGKVLEKGFETKEAASEWADLREAGQAA